MKNAKKRNKVGRPLGLNRRVRILETDEIYSNYIEAAKATESNRGDVYQCLMHYRKSHNGYRFEFVDEEIEEILSEENT